MDVQELRNLQEAYLDVYQELDEGSVADKARSAVANQRLDDAQRDTQSSVNRLRGRNEPVTRASASIAASKAERTARGMYPPAGRTGAIRIQEPAATASKPGVTKLGSRKGGTRSALMGMSSSLSTIGTPSGAKFMPGQGGRYGALGTGLADDYNVYDDVLEYLLGEGYTEEESNLIMVQLVTEGALSSGIAKGLGALAKFVQKRASTPLKTAATDVATTALGLGGTPTGAKLTTSALKAASPTPIVRTVKAPTARTAPRGANISPDPWKQPSAPRSAKPSTSPAKTPSTPKALTGSPTPRALTGTQARPALPSGAKGGPLAKATPGGALATREARSPRGAKPSFNRQALPQTKPTAEPAGRLATTRGAKPSFKPEALPKPKATTEPGGALVSTRSPRGAKPSFKPEALPKPKVTAEPGGKLTTTPKSGLSPQGQEIQRLNKLTGGGTLGSRELPKTPHRAPKPAWGNKATTPNPAPSTATSKALPKPTSTVKPSVKPSSGGSGAAAGGAAARGIKGILKTGLRAGIAGVAADMAFPEPTAPGTRDTAPKFPTTAKEVKKGETYYDPNTRVGPLGRFAQRKKVGPKIVGPGKVGTEAQSFDRTYGAALKEKGMGSTFKWNNKNYKVS